MDVSHEPDVVSKFERSTFELISQTNPATSFEECSDNKDLNVQEMKTCVERYE